MVLQNQPVKLRLPFPLGRAHVLCKPCNDTNVLVTPLMKGQTRNDWRGAQTTTRHFCSLFFVEHSLTYSLKRHSLFTILEKLNRL